MLKIHLWVLIIHIKKKRQNTFFKLPVYTDLIQFKMNIVIVFLTKQLIETFLHFLLFFKDSENLHPLFPPTPGVGSLFFRPLETFYKNEIILYTLFLNFPFPLLICLGNVSLTSLYIYFIKKPHAVFHSIVWMTHDLLPSFPTGEGFPGGSAVKTLPAM